MQTIELKGTAYERGLAQGEMMRGQYHKMFDTFLSSEMWRDHKPRGLPDSIIIIGLGLLGRFLTMSSVKPILPGQAERVLGLAKGLDVSLGLAWGLQFLEIIFCEAGKSIKAPNMGCTQLHAGPSATASGHPIIARNYDFPNLLNDFQIMRRDTPAEKGRLATVSMTQAPLTGANMGLNEAGLVICVNNSRQWKGPDFRYKGVPYQIMLMEALETCRTADEAIKFVTEFPARANAGFFGVMDAKGDGGVIEFTASRHSVRRPDDKGVMAQTNHFISMVDANLPEGTVWTVKGMEGLKYADSTNLRYKVADEMLREAAGSITVESLQKILSDHSAGDGKGTDLTVCTHGHTGSTLASVVVDIADMTMWVAHGTPCSNEYVKTAFRA